MLKIYAIKFYVYIYIYIYKISSTCRYKLDTHSNSSDFMYVNLLMKIMGNRSVQIEITMGDVRYSFANLIHWQRILAILFPRYD